MPEKTAKETVSPQFIMKSVDELSANPKNARTHSGKQIKKIAASIEKFKAINPIVCDSAGVIIAGHGRLEAAKMIGLEELQDDDFDLAFTGFDDVDIESIFGNDVAPVDGEDDVPTIPKQPYSKLGQIYKLGDHRIMCGDSTSRDDVDKLMDGEKVDMVFTDPPYGLGGYKGRGENSDRPVKNDEIDPDVFYKAVPSARNVYVWGAFENIHNLGFVPCDMIIWRKNNFGMGRGYRGQYEVCFYLGDFSGSDSDVWDVKKDTDYIHPTQKPVELIERAIKNSRPANVLDIFGGSGSTLIGCEKQKTPCYMMEIDPHYVDVIIARWEKFTGEKAELISEE